MKGTRTHERRKDERTRAHCVQARIRPGHRLVVIDVSACGALVEAGRPLRPESRVEVHLENEHRRDLLKARVTRCAVAALSTETGVTYRAALSFDERCEWVSEAAAHDGYDVPASASQKPRCDEDELPGAGAGRFGTIENASN